MDNSLGIMNKIQRLKVEIMDFEIRHDLKIT